MQEAVFKTFVKGIWCVQCPELIISGLLQQRGVVDADVAYFQSLVTVRYDPEIVTEEALRGTLTELGYPPFDRKPSAAERLAAKLRHLVGGAS